MASVPSSSRREIRRRAGEPSAGSWRFGKNWPRQIPTTRNYRRQLGFAYHNLGLSLAESGELAQALQHFRSELTLFESLQAADPRDAQARRNVSLAHKQIGDTLVRNSDWPAALDHYRAALDIDRGLSSSHTENAQALLDLTFSQGKYGMVLGKLGRRGEASAMLRKGVASQEFLSVEPRPAARSAPRVFSQQLHAPGAIP